MEKGSTVLSIFFILKSVGKAILIFGFALLPFLAFTQKIPPSQLNFSETGRLRGELDEFYRLTDSQCIWHFSAQTPILLEQIKQSGYSGIHNQIEPLKISVTSRDEDIIQQDISLTKTALQLMNDLQCGTEKPTFGYEGLAYECQLPFAGRLLKDALKSKKLKDLFDQLNTMGTAFDSLFALHGRLVEKLEAPGYEDIKIARVKTKDDSLKLFGRLIQLSIINETVNNYNGSRLQNAILKAQLMFDEEPDGKINRNTLAAINIPVAERIRELAKSLDFIRWSRKCNENELIILLNIPAARLKVFQDDSMVLESKVIVGKPSTPTPTLTGIIDKIILYPFWTVPYKIATREMLPIIRKDRGYLERGNYQVLNRSGKVVDPAAINWRSLSSAYFPFVIRQSTGCDNALGTVKFDFENPYSVYLHDTPGKELFRRRKRFFSHGCMRIEKPVELARLLLKENRIAIDSLTEKGCLLQQSPITVKANRKAGLIVHYNTAWYDNQAGVVFYSDIYSKNKKGHN